MTSRTQQRHVTALALSAATYALGVAATPMQTFRAGTDVVFVHVLVRNGAVPVTSLRAQDFLLFDNGFPQPIDQVSAEQMPIELSVVLDTSGSTSPVVAAFAANAQRLTAMLRPDDHVRVVAFATAVVEAVPLQPAGQPVSFGFPMPAGGTSLNDALLLSLVRPAAPGRRHLIVAFTDGVDTSSVIDTVAVNQTARRSDSVLHLLLANPNNLPPAEIVARTRLLREAAETTGGEVHASAVTDAVAALDRVFNDFRHSYVLRYSPRNVSGTGWREISVRLAGPNAERYAVRARKGYFAR